MGNLILYGIYTILLAIVVAIGCYALYVLFGDDIWPFFIFVLLVIAAIVAITLIIRGIVYLLTDEDI